MKKIFITIFLVALAFTVSAQSITPTQLRNARRSAYEWISIYSSRINFASSNAENRYIKLFSSPSAMVWNDYIPDANYPYSNPNTTASEYAAMRKNDSLLYNLRYKKLYNAQIVSERVEANTIIFGVTFDEDLYFVAKDSKVSEKEKGFYRYPDITKTLRAELVYNIDNQKITATSVLLADDKDKMKPFVVLRIDDSLHMTSAESIKNAVLGNMTATVRSTLSQSKFDPKFYVASLDTLRHAIGLQILLGSGSVGTNFEHPDRYDNVQGKLSSLAIGLGYYNQLALKNRSRWGLETGVRYQSVSDKWTLDYSDVCYDIDLDNGYYQRLVDAVGYEEQMKYSSLQVPLNLRYDYFINPQYLSLFARAGVAAGYARSRSFSASAENFHVRGYYDWLFHVTLDQEGIYDFGTFSDHQFDNTEYDISSFAIDAVVGLGLAAYYNSFSFELSANFNSTLIQKVNANDNYHLSPSINKWQSVTNDLSKISNKVLNIQLQINYHF